MFAVLLTCPLAHVFALQHSLPGLAGTVAGPTEPTEWLAAEQAHEADEAFGGTVARSASVARTKVPPNARAGQNRRGHRFAAYARCSADPRRRGRREIVRARLETHVSPSASARTGTGRACLLREALEAREAFRARRCDATLLARLYEHYNPVPRTELFVERALDMFPSLCCGLASVYLQYRLGEGTVTRGSFRNEQHTFLLTRGCVVDITADQFGGPEVYVGLLAAPWHAEAASQALRVAQGGRRTSG